MRAWRREPGLSSGTRTLPDQPAPAPPTAAHLPDRYRRLFDIIDVGFCVIDFRFDAADRALDYRFLEVNAAFERQTGLIDAVGCWMRDLAPTHEQHWYDVYGAVARTGEAIRFEDEAAGVGRWYDVHAYPVDAPEDRHVALVFNDITARKQAELSLQTSNEALEAEIAARAARLRDAEDFSRLALGAVGGVGVWTYDVGEDRFRFDDAIADLYALPAGSGEEGLSRQAFLANVHPDDVAALRQTMSGGLVVSGDLELEYRLVHRDGSIRWVNSRGHTYFDEAGRAFRRTGVGVEVTRRRELEDALRQAQKMEAVGQLTGGIAHDFNNLLQGISGALELLQSRVAQGRYDAVDRYASAAQGAARRAATLTQRLLAFSRRQTLDPRATEVNGLLVELRDLLRRSVGPTVTVELAGGLGVWPILVDANQLENAVLNLCINARDAMPDGGRIVIETENNTLDERSAREHDLPPEQYVCLSVTDAGTGMSKETLSRIFDPFFTTKPLGQGTGLGLSMVYGFVRQSGGQVRVRSELGRGTTFSLYFPRHQGEAETAESPLCSGVGEGLAGDGKTVLVVDDEPTIRLLIAEVLEDMGFRCVEGSDGAAALAILQSNIPVDLLITDVGLPRGLNGRQVFDAARVARPDLPTLFVTGYAETVALGDGLADPGTGLLTKPFTIAALTAKVQELLAP